MCWSTCFCWSDVRRATSVIGLFSAVTSAIQILITAVVFAAASALYGGLSFSTANVTTYISELYIALAGLDFIVILLSLLLLCGNERTRELTARNYILPWVIFMPLYVIYESATNIYFFNSAFSNTIPITIPVYFFFNTYNYTFSYIFPLYPTAITQYNGFLAIPLVYWLIKDALILYSVGHLIYRLNTPLSVPTFVGVRSRLSFDLKPRPVCLPACTEVEVARQPNIVNVYTPVKVERCEPTPACIQPTPPTYIAAPQPCYYTTETCLEDPVSIYDRQTLYQPRAQIPVAQPWYNYARRWLPNTSGYGRSNFFQ